MKNWKAGQILTKFLDMKFYKKIGFYFTCGGVNLKVVPLMDVA
jgi:hypothetical protein